MKNQVLNSYSQESYFTFCAIPIYIEFRESALILVWKDFSFEDRVLQLDCKSRFGGVDPAKFIWYFIAHNILCQHSAFFFWNLNCENLNLDLIIWWAMLYPLPTFSIWPIIKPTFSIAKWKKRINANIKLTIWSLSRLFTY